MTMPPKRPPPPPPLNLAEGAVASLTKDTGAAEAQGLAQGLAKTFILQGAGLTAAVELVFMFEEKSMDVLTFAKRTRAFSRRSSA